MITYFYELYYPKILQRNSPNKDGDVVVALGNNKATYLFKSSLWCFSFLDKVVLIAYDGGEANLGFANHNMGQTIFV